MIGWAVGMNASGARATNGLIGVFGLTFGAFFLKRCSDVLHSPGDDNPIALLFVFAAALACIPSWGVVRLVDAPLRRWSLLWVAVSVVTLAMLGVVAAQFS
jgi:hypothetical protein